MNGSAPRSVPVVNAQPDFPFATCGRVRASDLGADLPGIAGGSPSFHGGDAG